MLSLDTRRYRRLDDGTTIDVGRWADARHIVAGSIGRRLLLVDAATGATRDLGPGTQPSVSRNGRWLAYLDVSEESDLWMAAPADRR